MEERDNLVLIGQKDMVCYVFAINTQAERENEICVKARGQNISKAVDVVQVALSRHLKDWMVKSVEIGTHDLIDKETSETYKKSYINILIGKK